MRDPAHPLLTVAETAAETESEQGQHLGQRPALLWSARCRCGGARPERRPPRPGRCWPPSLRPGRRGTRCRAARLRSVLRRRGRRRRRSPTPTAARGLRRRPWPDARPAATWSGCGSRPAVRRYSSVQRWSPMPAPARLITASAGSRTAGSSRPLAGSQTTSVPVGLLRTSRTTVWPSARSRATSAVPISPVEPETTMCTSQTIRPGIAREGCNQDRYPLPTIDE